MSVIKPYRHRTIARNTHVVEAARRAISAVSPVIQQHCKNAIDVSGFPIFVYRRLTGGLPCSCSAGPTAQEPDLYDEQGHAAPSLLNSLAHQSRFGVEVYGGGRSVATPPASVNNLVATPGFETCLTDSVSIEEGQPDGEFSLSVFNASACGICHGTGFKGGYSFLQGTRTVLDYSDLEETNVIEIDRNTAPYSMRFLLEDGEVTFKLPFFINGSPMVITLYNNFERVYPARLLVDPALPLANSYYTSSILISPRGYFTLNFSKLQKDITFTHVEVVQRLNKAPVLADFPSLPSSFDPSRLVGYTDTQVVLPPTLPRLSPRDVITDMYYGLRWLVTSSTAMVGPATGNQTWHHTADCRPLEPHEPLSTLLLPTYELTGYALKGNTHHHFNVSRKGGY